MTNQTLTRKVADFVLEDHLSTCSPEDLDMLKTAIADWIAVTLSGSIEESVSKLMAVMKDQTESGTSTIIGHNCKTSSLWATLINGTAAHSQDFDDIHDYLSMHLTVPICSAAFMAAEQVKASGAELMSAISNAMQLMVGIAAAIMPEHYQNLWHATATIGIFGAAAASGRLLGLSPEQLCHAFGIAASKSSGIQATFGSMTKPMQPAQASRNGYEAALLAKEGFTSCEDIFGSNYLSMLSSRVDTEQMLPRMQGSLAVHELRYKRFPCGAPTHSGIYNSLSLIREYNFSVSDITKIVLEPYPRAIRLAGELHPQTGLAGKFSLPFCTAAAIVTGRITNKTFTEEVLSMPAIQDLLDKIELVPNEYYTPSRGGKATFYLFDGRILSHDILLLGQQVNSRELQQSVYEKFMEIAPEIIGEKAEHLWLSIQQLEQIDNTAILLDLMSR